jgi:4-amino-4-deoxy-L-arabinose transferase-like glycosyltransferase
MASPDPPNAASRRTRARALLALFALSFAFLGSRGLLEPDEGRYSNVAAQMLRSGDWAVPALNDSTPHYTKPPLTYWTIAASTALLGHHPWAARLPNALAWIATVLLVGAIARRLGEGSGAAASVVYATLLLPYLGASIVTTDTLLAAFETLAVLGLVGLWRRPDATARLALGCGLGAGFLTKGPVALLPLLPMAATLAWRGEAAALRRWLHPAVWLPFLAIGGSWFAWLGATQPDVLRAMLHEEIYGRVVEGRFDRHPEWYGALRVYLPAFLLGALPWSPWLLAQPRRLAGLVRPSGWRERRDRDPAGLFLLLWLLIPLAVLAMVRSRLPLYLLPSFAPLALLVARRLDLDDLRREPGRGLLLSWLVVLVGARALAAWLPLEEMSAHVLERGIRREFEVPPERIVFVDDTPRWGLGYTFDAVVEGTVLNDTGDPFPPLETVLPGPDGDRIFVVRRVSECDFRDRAEAAGYGVRWRGAWDHQVYLSAERLAPGETPPPTSARCAWEAWARERRRDAARGDEGPASGP